MKEKPYVYVARKVPEDVIEPLKEIAEVGMWESEEEPVPYEILKKEASQADALFTTITEKIDQSLIENNPHLKVVANVAVGYDNIDVPFATKKGIYVCHTPDVLSDTTADLTFALLMATARRIVESHQFVKNGLWKDWGPLLLVGHDIHHKTIGIVGMGRIGEKVAKRATGFDMNILYHNRSRKEQAEKNLGAKYCSFEELLESSDFVVNTAPLTEKTKHLFNDDAFKRMKKTAVFINSGRGPVVDEEALINALKNNEIAAAGLDVFDKEPISNDHPLLSFDNVVVLPHIGSASIDTRYKMMKMTTESILDVLNGKTPTALVNKELAY
jgi:glyoxylate reductase